jgi:hypothetical protein
MAFAADLQATVRQLQNAEDRVAHLERILRQAVMTNGGQLVIDSKYGEEALESKAKLWIGGGGVELFENEVMVIKDHWGKP